MKFKKCAVIAAALALSATIMTPANAATYRQFDDLENPSWYRAYVMAANEADLLPPGYGSLFEGDKGATVSEFSYSFLRSRGIWTRSAKTGETWQQVCLETVSQLIGEDLEDGPITRQKAAQIIAIVDKIPMPVDSEESPFIDTDDKYAIALYNAQVLGGISCEGGVAFAGNQVLTRCQMAVLIQRTQTLPNGYQSPLYVGISDIGTLIDPNTPLPQEPKSAEEFRQVMEYMMVHDLTELTLTYKGEKPSTFLADVKDVIAQVLHILRYERSEYFNYLPKTSLRSLTNKDGTYSLTIVFAAADGDTDAMLTCRREAFALANKQLQELYTSGELMSSMTELERAQVIAKWVASSTKYVDASSRLDHTAWSVFTRGTGVCDGYSSALQLMLSMDNIQCWGQAGYVNESGGFHQWTLTVLDGTMLGIDSVRYATSDSGFGMTPELIASFYTVER